MVKQKNYIATNGAKACIKTSTYSAVLYVETADKAVLADMIPYKTERSAKSAMNKLLSNGDKWQEIK